MQALVSVTLIGHSSSKVIVGRTGLTEVHNFGRPLIILPIKKLFYLIISRMPDFFSHYSLSFLRNKEDTDISVSR